MFQHKPCCHGDMFLMFSDNTSSQYKELSCIIKANGQNMRFIGVNIRFTKVDDIIGLNKLLRHFIRIIGVNFDMLVSENLRFTVYGGLIVISVYRGNFNRLKCGFQKKFGLTGFSVYRGSVYRG